MKLFFAGSKFSKSAVLMILLAAFCINAQQRSLVRDSIDAKYKWNFSDIYSGWDKWEKDLKAYQEKAEDLIKLKGTIKDGPKALLKIFILQDEMGMLSTKLFQYPSLQSAVDSRNQEVAAKLQTVQAIASKLGSQLSWITPEMLQIPFETMEKWINSTKELEVYRFGVESTYKLQQHVLSEDKEKLLSYNGPFAGTPYSIYTALSTADINFPKVKFSNGTEVPATAGNYSRTLTNNWIQEDRKNIFEAHYKTYKQNENTYAAIYNATCQRDWASAQARNYKSCLEASLDANNIPTAVYTNLVETAKKNFTAIHKYNALRKKILGLKEYHVYDGSLPLIKSDKTYPYEEAKEYVFASVAPLGKEYQARVTRAFQSGWLDVYENTGKQPGAFSSRVYGVHPYMLLNYNETMRWMFTLAHEMGHTIHSLLATETQAFTNVGYTLFVAEVASTFNERLLLEYMLEKTNDPKERAALLMQAIENINGTFFFQSLLADFELQIHQRVEKGEPITAEVLNSVMEEMEKNLQGDAFTHDELLNTVWARIAHFNYVPFYVYQYATCYASSAQMYESLKNLKGKERDAAVEKYLNLLRSGGNDYPMEQLKKAGVDLTTAAPFEAVCRQFESMVAQLEKEMKKIK